VRIGRPCASAASTSRSIAAMSASA
jgi:hypothetical protein